jgi:predicted O-methyltransferase YrrM
LKRLLLRYFRGRADYLDTLLFERSMDAKGLAHARSIRSWTAPRELRALFDLAAAAPPDAIAMEIGSYLGASSCYLAAALAPKGGRLFCVDTWTNETMPDGERDTFAEFMSHTRPVSANITAIRRRSEELSEGDIPGPVNLAFIDGDHGYDAVRRDFEIVRRRLAPDGIVAFHDFGDPQFPGVTRVVGEALATGDWMQRGLMRTLAWITPARPDVAPDGESLPLRQK